MSWFCIEYVVWTHSIPPTSYMKDKWLRVEKHTSANSSEDYVIFKMFQHKHAFEVATKARHSS